MNLKGKLTIGASLVVVFFGGLFIGAQMHELTPTGSSADAETPPSTKPIRTEHEKEMASVPSGQAQAPAIPTDADAKGDYTVLPSSMLASLNITVLSNDRKISPKFAITAGLLPGQVEKLNNAIATADAQLEQLRRQKIAIKSTTKDHSVISISSLGQDGERVKQQFMAALTADLDPGIKKYLLPQLEQRLDSQFGYFGKYPQEVIIMPRGDNIYTVNRRVLFNDTRSTVQVTANMTSKEQLMAEYPGLAL